MTSDMGGIYRIADALKADTLQANPEIVELQKLDRAISKERLELDRRALAIQYAKDTARLDFRTDKDPNPPPQHERVLEAAEAYYGFLLHGPSGAQDS